MSAEVGRNFQFNEIVHKRMAPSRMLRRVALVRTDVSDEISISIIRVTRIGELGRMLAVSRNRRTLRKFYFILFLFNLFPRSLLRLLAT
jgi:hypothetical protein